MDCTIAIATEDGERIARHFGRTPYFLKVTIEDGEIKRRDLVPNTFTGHFRSEVDPGTGGGRMMGGPGGTHHHLPGESHTPGFNRPGGGSRGGGGPGDGHGGGPHRVLQALGDCRSVICCGAGRRIWQAMNEAGIEMIVTDEERVEDALNAYLDGMLKHTGKLCSGGAEHRNETD